MLAATTPESDATEPTERSIPPLRMTSDIPAAMMPSMLFCRSTLSRFSIVKNAGYLTAATAHTTINESAGVNTWPLRTTPALYHQRQDQDGRARDQRPRVSDQMHV